MLAPVFSSSQKEIPVLKTIASEKAGVPELYKIISAWDFGQGTSGKIDILVEKAWAIVQSKKMKHLNKATLRKELSEAATRPGFNLYRFAEKYV